MKINKIKRCIDVVLTLVLLFLMAYQVTGDILHEWIGIGMTVIVIAHQVLNRRWYMAIAKGKYKPYRIVMTVIDILLLLCFFTTAFCGMAMSNHAVPFMNGIIPLIPARQMHLAFSYWSFVLAGIHIGFHLSTLISKLKKKSAKIVLLSASTVLSVCGFWLFFKSNIFSYMFLTTHFAFLDYNKNPVIVVFENLIMLLAWAFAGMITSILLTSNRKRRNTNENSNS
ncbi:MAG: DUF4405 domain-containing protein [Clostridia bacterium]|nr:DUF4405 domain-containing protein [Clostridia bacterium]